MIGASRIYKVKEGNELSMEGDNMVFSQLHKNPIDMQSKEVHVSSECGLPVMLERDDEEGRLAQLIKPIISKSGRKWQCAKKTNLVSIDIAQAR